MFIDHTSGLATGKYIFIDAYYAVNQVFGDIGNKSRLYSKIYYKNSASDDCTFLMYYHMYGVSHSGSLSYSVNAVVIFLYFFHRLIWDN